MQSHRDVVIVILLLFHMSGIIQQLFFQSGILESGNSVRFALGPPAPSNQCLFFTGGNR